MACLPLQNLLTRMKQYRAGESAMEVQEKHNLARQFSVSIIELDGIETQIKRA